MKRYAVIVGINDYKQGSGLAPLQYAEADAQRLANVLKKEYGFTTRLLTGNKATRDNIELSVNNCGKGDLFLFFFAGHGSDIKGGFHLYPIDSNARGDKALLFDSLAKTWQHDFHYPKVLALLDACRSEFGGIGQVRAARGLSPVIARDIKLAAQGNTLVDIVYGCSEGEVSYEDEELKHGLFSHALAEILESVPPFLDINELADRTGDIVRDWCKKSSKGFLQNPRRYSPMTAKNKIILCELQAQPKKAAELLCPLCGGFNREKIETFQCKGCGRDNLCLSHRDAKLFVCPECAKKKIAAESKRQEKINSKADPSRTEPGSRALPKIAIALVVCLIGGVIWFQNRDVGSPQVAVEKSSEPAVVVDRTEQPARSAAVESLINDKESIGKVHGLDMKFTLIKGGCYQMGQTEGEKKQLIKAEGKEKYDTYYGDELPRKEICLNDFYLGMHEVTVGSWRKFVEATGYKSDAEKNSGGSKGAMVLQDNKWQYVEGRYWDNPGFSQTDAHPVTCVSYNDVLEFIKWLNEEGSLVYRLPSEAEWEYAARGGADTIRYWTDNLVEDSQACIYANVADQTGTWNKHFPCKDDYRYSTAPVGQFEPNNYNLYDMLGNVWEWCSDRSHGSYDGIPANGFSWDSGSSSLRVVRGGGWVSGPARLRSANRFGDGPEGRGYYLGFRLAASQFSSR